MTALPGGLLPETTVATAATLSIASFNVENLDPGDTPDKFRRLAEQIVQNLKTPDILGLMEPLLEHGAGVGENPEDRGLLLSGFVPAVRARLDPGDEVVGIVRRLASHRDVDRAGGGEGENVEDGMRRLRVPGPQQVPARALDLDLPARAASGSTFVERQQGDHLAASDNLELIDGDDRSQRGAQLEPMRAQADRLAEDFGDCGRRSRVAGAFTGGRVRMVGELRHRRMGMLY